MQEIVREIFLDHIAFVTTADNEIVHAVGRVQLHDVPKDRLATDLDHGFGLKVCFLGDSCAEAPSENDSFHRFNLVCVDNQFSHYPFPASLEALTILIITL